MKMIEKAYIAILAGVILMGCGNKENDDEFQARDLSVEEVREVELSKAEEARIEAAVRNELGSDAGMPFEGELTDEVLTKLDYLDLSGEGLTDLSPLSKFKGLKELDLNLNLFLEDLKPLSDLKQLRRLSVRAGKISDIKPLSALTNMEVLDLSTNQIEDLAPLKGLKKLEVLHINGSKLSRLDPLHGLTNLKYIDLKQHLGKIIITKAEIEKLQKALPQCEIRHNAN